MHDSATDRIFDSRWLWEPTLFVCVFVLEIDFPLRYFFSRLRKHIYVQAPKPCNASARTHRESVQSYGLAAKEAGVEVTLS